MPGFLTEGSHDNKDAIIAAGANPALVALLRSEQAAVQEYGLCVPLFMALSRTKMMSWQRALRLSSLLC